jgi:pseudoazurin
MYKTRAVIITTLIALVGLYVVVTVMTVFSHDSASRYGEISTPEPGSSVVVQAKAPTQDIVEPQPEPMPEPEPIVEPEPITEPEMPEPVVPVAEVEAPPVVPATDTPPAAEGGAVHVVTAQGLVYAPLVITVQPGDIVAWENMSTHDTQSMEGLIPDGAEHWHSAMGENFQRTFTVEGIYIYKCTPHFGAGMGGAIIVGKPTNLDAIQNSGAKGAAKRLVKKAVAAAANL